MVFSSSVFLFAFMPVFFAVYFALRGRKARNVWTLVASLFFYAWGEPVYILLMLASIACNWAFALAIGRTGGTVHAKKPTPPPRQSFEIACS